MARSGNPKPTKDPNIAEKGKNTRFGAAGGADPTEAAKSPAKRAKVDARSELRYLALQDIEDVYTDDGALNIPVLDRQVARLSKDGTGKTTMSRAIAARTLERALKQADPATLSMFYDNVSGRLAQDINIPPPEKAPIPKTLEEAERIYKEHMRR